MSKVPRARSKQIKELQVDFILPLVALNLADVTTSHEASRVLHKFYSEEVTNLFAKILAKDSHGAFFTQPVFEFLSDTCSRVNSNAIITTLLDIPYLKQPDQLGSPVAALAFRTIVAIAKNVGLSPKQDVLVNAMVEEELHRAYRKVVVVDFLNAVYDIVMPSRFVVLSLSLTRDPHCCRPFSGMICNYLRSQLELTLERVMLLLACLLPFDPIDEYAVSLRNATFCICPKALKPVANRLLSCFPRMLAWSPTLSRSWRTSPLEESGSACCHLWIVGMTGRQSMPLAVSCTQTYRAESMMCWKSTCSRQARSGRPLSLISSSRTRCKLDSALSNLCSICRGKDEFNELLHTGSTFSTASTGLGSELT